MWHVHYTFASIWFPKKNKKSISSKSNGTEEKQEDSQEWLNYWVGRLRNTWMKIQIILNTPYLKVTMFFQSSYEMVPNFFLSIFHFFSDSLNLNDILPWFLTLQCFVKVLQLVLCPHACRLLLQPTTCSMLVLDGNHKAIYDSLFNMLKLQIGK